MEPPSLIKYKKQKIPTAVREQVWVRHMGRVFEGKCCIYWCSNRITVFDFQSGHNIPESKGGETTVENLVPICSRCNLSMSDNYTIDQWNKAFTPKIKEIHPHPPKKKGAWKRFLCLFKNKNPNK